MKKTIFVLLVLNALFCNINAQNIDISGTWEGIITQEEGGVAHEYTFKIFMKLDEEGSVEGTAFVALEKMDIYASMQFTGFFDGTYISIEEEKILREKMVEGFFWCLKTYHLKLSSNDMLELEGNWTGHTLDGFCVPGKIYLKKSAPRV